MSYDKERQENYNYNWHQGSQVNSPSFGQLPVKNFEPDHGYDPIEFEQAQRRLALATGQHQSRSSWSSKNYSGSDRHSSNEKDSILSDIAKKIEKKVNAKFVNILEMVKAENRTDAPDSLVSVILDYIKKVVQSEEASVRFGKETPQASVNRLSPIEDNCAEENSEENLSLHKKSRKSSRSRSVDIQDQPVPIQAAGKPLGVESQSNQISMPPLSNPNEEEVEDEKVVFRDSEETKKPKLIISQIFGCEKPTETEMEVHENDTSVILGTKISIRDEGPDKRVINLVATGGGFKEITQNQILPTGNNFQSHSWLFGSTNEYVALSKKEMNSKQSKERFMKAVPLIREVERLVKIINPRQPPGSKNSGESRGQ